MLARAMAAQLPQPYAMTPCSNWECSTSVQDKTVMVKVMFARRSASSFRSCRSASSRTASFSRCALRRLASSFCSCSASVHCALRRSASSFCSLSASVRCALSALRRSASASNSHCFFWARERDHLSFTFGSHSLNTARETTTWKDTSSVSSAFRFRCALRVVVLFLLGLFPT